MSDATTSSPVRKARRRRRGPTAETRASARAVRAEISKAASLRVVILDDQRFPTLCRLLATAEHWAAARPAVKTFRFEGSGYRWAETNLGRLIVSYPDGRSIVGSGPGLMWNVSQDGPGVTER